VTKSFSFKCISCGYAEEFNRLIATCPECDGEWLEIVYNLNETAYIWQHELPQRDRTMWRYWELLPMQDKKHIVSMGEGWTPLLRAENLGTMLGRRNIFIKDERQGPTASFKDRQASLAISVLKEADIKELVVASTGNVAISYSAYCARSGIKLWAFLDSNVPHEKMREVTLYGAEVIKVSSNYDRTKQVAAQFAKYRNLFLDKGVKGISAREAMKTLAFEIAEQLGRARGVGWAAPDWYIQAVSGGMGPIGVWQGFYELFKMGLIKKLPKLAIIRWLPDVETPGREDRHHRRRRADAGRDHRQWPRHGAAVCTRGRACDVRRSPSRQRRGDGEADRGRRRASLCFRG
jgi:threonine synthase